MSRADNKVGDLTWAGVRAYKPIRSLEVRPVRFPYTISDTELLTLQVDPPAPVDPRVQQWANERVEREVASHRRYAEVLGLNETETDARLDGVAVEMRERIDVTIARMSYAMGPFGHVMIGSVLPTRMPPDEVERIVRSAHAARPTEIDDRVVGWAVAASRDAGYPVYQFPSRRCEGPATREVHDRDRERSEAAIRY